MPLTPESKHALTNVIQKTFYLLNETWKQDADGKVISP